MAELKSLTLIPDVLNQEIQVQFGLKLKIPMGLIRLNENTKLKSSCSKVNIRIGKIIMGFSLVLWNKVKDCG